MSFAQATARAQKAQARDTRLFFRKQAPSTFQPRLLMRSACTKMKWGDLKGAIAKLKQILEVNPDDKFAISKLIQAHSRRGEFREASALYQRAFNRRIADAFIVDAMVNCHLRQNDVEGAKAVLGKAAEKGCCEARTYVTVGGHLYSKGMFYEALELLEHAPKKIVWNPKMFLLKMELKRKLGEREHALKELEAFLSKYPFKSFGNKTYVKARVIRAFCLKDMGRAEEAHSEFEVLKQNVPKKNRHYPRILCGHVFSSTEMEEREARFSRRLLEIFKRHASGNLLKDINAALEKLANMQLPAPQPQFVTQETQRF